MKTIRLTSLIFALSIGTLAIAGQGAYAQDKGSVNPKPLPPLTNPNDPSTPAKELFGRKTRPASSLSPEAIGFYSAGCLSGGVALPINGNSWQVMRLSRNRNWGHPRLVSFLERFADRVPGINGWPGLLVGDMSQPRGGPMITGHASHQIGIDADIWLIPMPNRTLSRAERENMSAVNMVRKDRLDIDPSVWTDAHYALIRAAAKEREVERIFVNPAIKRALCRTAGNDRSWLNKVRPMWGHNYHFHIRLSCPSGSGYCQPQDPVPAADQCGAELDKWFTPEMLNPKPGKRRPPMTMAKLPPACRTVLDAN
ncbi:penicillin-insensitive murein endopeptidase [Microvirga sp. W0021]|uniref:Penicillin-insensitive murein endopeptidase n=1 Tax=Hohaiivirga grylli TaxID=3133970 RepID=A0ABV0BG23_9HYPH